MRKLNLPLILVTILSLISIFLIYKKGIIYQILWAIGTSGFVYMLFKDFQARIKKTNK